MYCTVLYCTTAGGGRAGEEGAQLPHRRPDEAEDDRGERWARRRHGRVYPSCRVQIIQDQGKVTEIEMSILFILKPSVLKYVALLRI